MALQSVKGFIAWPPDNSLGWSGYTPYNTLAFTLDAATEKMSFVFIVPPAGGNLTVTDVAFLITGYSGTGNLDVRVETVGTDGNPSGTLAGTNTNLVMSISSDGVKTATLTASASLTAGTAYAVVFAYSSGTYGIAAPRADSGDRNALIGGHMAYVRFYVSGAWSASTVWMNTAPCFALKLSGGTYANLPGVNGVSTMNRTTFNNTTTVRKRGAAFVPRFPGTVCGWSLWGGGFASTDFTVELRSTAGSLLATYSADKDYGNYYSSANVNYNNFTRGYFAATYDVAAGTTYDLLLVPGSATNMALNVASIMVTGETNSINLFNGGADCIQVEIDDASARTTDNTKRPMMSLLFSKLDDGAGAGGGGGLTYIAGMTGGMTG
jgi:hypothetical protein